ncbi:MAG: fimbrillin family protein [Bacteroidales bacterium]|nr:fimbrillin family protein [Bacteroidales bacterium]
MRPFCKFSPLCAVILMMASVSCLKVDDIPTVGSKRPGGANVGFDIKVTREGEEIGAERQGIMTKGDSPAYDSSDALATMDPSIPFGLVGIDYDHHALVVDNASVNSDGSNYGAFLDSMFWDDIQTQTISFSAYYPYVKDVHYSDELESYSIPYSVEETQAGPLVSKTVEMAVAQLNMIPLEFQHITNDIGYRICDVTPVEGLQGLVHLRKLTAYNVASAGVFVNDITLSRGIWHRQGYYRTVVVFEGDAKVGVGSENEKFVGFDTLEDHMVNSHRYYSIPDEIEIGKQYIEVVYDVEGFDIGGFHYPPLENQVARYMLYGLLPDNVFVYGRQYTFHVGIDLSSVYREISFSASVSDWETKIYENNDDF